MRRHINPVVLSDECPGASLNIDFHKSKIAGIGVETTVGRRTDTHQSVQCLLKPHHYFAYSVELSGSPLALDSIGK